MAIALPPRFGARPELPTGSSSPGLTIALLAVVKAVWSPHALAPVSRWMRGYALSVPMVVRDPVAWMGRLGLLVAWIALTSVASRAAEPELIKVIGGLAGVTQFTRYEEPFWARRIPGLTGGRLRAEISPFDRSGIRGQEMLPLMQLGVVPFGNVLLGLASADAPELNAIDLPTLSPDFPALLSNVARWRPHLAAVLREQYGIELLAIYTYPAQVVFCREAFSGLADLAGRRVRTSSVGQSDLTSALGGIPVVIPFAETVNAIRDGVVDCAITGTLSGNAIGLHTVTTHVSRQAISWGLSVFGANTDTWSALPDAVRQQILHGLGELESEIWTAASKETDEGLLCNAGRPGCQQGQPGRMVVVESGADSSTLRQLLSTAVLPSWIRRCGHDCASAWNRIMAVSPHLPAAVE